MSGAYGNRFLGARLCWEVERRVRKIFSSEDQSESYHQEHDQAAKARFLAALPCWEAALAGADVLAFDPFLDNQSSRGRDKDLGRSVPLNVRLDVSRSDDVSEHLELTLAKPRSAEALEKLRGSLRDAASEIEGEEPADFQNPVAAVRWGERLGLYVGVRMEARPEVADALRPRLQEALDLLWPIVESKAKEFPVRSGRIQDSVLEFNPWGPLLDGRFMRESWQMGSVDLRIAFQPATADRRIFLEEWFKTAMSAAYR